MVLHAERAAPRARRAEVRCERRDIGARLREDRTGGVAAIGADTRNVVRVGEERGPVCDRRRGTDADELRFGTDETGGAEGAGKETGRCLAAELTDAATHDPRRGAGEQARATSTAEAATTTAASTATAEATGATTSALITTGTRAVRRTRRWNIRCPREADTRAGVHFARKVVGAAAEELIDRRIVLRTAIKTRPLGANTVRHLEGTIRAPGIAEVNRRIHRFALTARRFECARVLRRHVRGEIGERVERIRTELIRRRRLIEGADVHEHAKLRPVRATALEVREFVTELELLGGVVGRKPTVAAERQRADAGRAVGEQRRDADASFGHHEERALFLFTAVRIQTNFVDDAVVERRADRGKKAAAERARIAAVRRHGERTEACRISLLPVPVAAKGQRVAIAEGEIFARECGDAIGVRIGRSERRRGGNAVAAQETEESRRRIGADVVAEKNLVVGAEQRLEAGGAAVPTCRAEPESGIAHERAAETEAELILCELLAEVRRRAVGKLQIGFVQHPADGALHAVRAAARRTRHLTAGELPASDVEGIGDDARVAHGFGRHAAGAERHAVERDLVLVGALAGD